MQHHQHQGGGSQYGAPPPTDMGPFSTPPAAGPVPLSSRPPPPQPTQQQQPQPSYDELGGAGGFPDDDMLGGDSGGNSGGALGSGGNRWPREETLALIRIRSEMDATFRDATLKGPLWEDVSRKLADLGYKRNAKKCKEKFENVHKYYKRTKEGRAGRQDGKSYRFFQELEALHGPLARSPLPPVSTAPQMSAIMPPPPGPIQPAPISSVAPAPAPAAVEHPQPPPVSLQGLNFPSMSDSESDDDDSEDDDMTAETGGSPDGVGKRKRVGSRKMMAFFEGLMKQVIQRQEEMQVKFLETMEKREAERTAREEAWRRQEVARLNREQEQLAHDRAAAASRDASIIAFLQRIGAQTLQAPPVVIPMPMQVQTPPPPKQPRQQLTPLPPSPQVAAQPKPIPATPLQQQPKPIPAAPLQQQPKPIPAPPIQQQPPPIPAAPIQQQHKETTTHQEAAQPRSAPAPHSGGSSLALVPVVAEQHVEAVEGGGGASSSRWPKTEVHALIQLRMDMDNRYQENGPKGPLWEEISAGMRRLGYNRNSKRCKEKWENINKYFKKVKESNKRRPEDSKTCPYFHQLEAIYRKKHISSAAAGNAVNAVVPVPAAVTEQLSLNRHEIEGKKINDIDKRDNGGIGAAQVRIAASQGLASNGQTMPTTATLDIDLGAKKPEDTLRELGEQPHREFTTDETDSDDMGDDYTDDGEDGEDDGNMQYRIQFQRPNPVGTNNASPPAATPTTVVPTSTPASSFLAMVK